MLRNVLYLILILFIVVWASAVSSHLWAGKEELQPENIAVTVSKGMTVAEFGKKYDLSRKTLKKAFNLTSQDDLKKQVADSGMNEALLSRKVNQVLAIQAEHESRNWFKIPLKGLLWIIFLFAVFNLIRKGKITARNRKWIYMTAVGVFGIILGSDPSPMRTVKDAILKQDRIIPDCFSCGTCMETCPVNAISFERGKRQKPPAGKFDKEVMSD